MTFFKSGGDILKTTKKKTDFFHYLIFFEFVFEKFIHFKIIFSNFALNNNTFHLRILPKSEIMFH